MIINKVKKAIVGLTLVVMLLAGIGGVTAQAQGRGFHGPRPAFGYRPHFYRPYGAYRWWGWYGPYGSPTITVVNPIAQQRESGYSDGHKRGREDARAGKPESPDSHKHYSKSDSRTYRQAFLEGYDDGYNEQINKAD